MGEEIDIKVNVQVENGDWMTYDYKLYLDPDLTAEDFINNFTSINNLENPGYDMTIGGNHISASVLLFRNDIRSALLDNDNNEVKLVLQHLPA